MLPSIGCTVAPTNKTESEFYCFFKTKQKGYLLVDTGSNILGMSEGSNIFKPYNLIRLTMLLGNTPLDIFYCV